MKSTIIKSVVALMAFMPLITSCDDELEVGTTLFPTEAENPNPKVYINETSLPVNTTTAEIVQTPLALLIPEDTCSFYIRLTRPVASDVTVTVAEDPALAQEYDNTAEALPMGTVSMVTATVTIPAGQQESTEPVKFVVPECDALRNFNGSAVSVIKIAKVESADMVSIGADHYTYYMLFNKKVTNYKGNDNADLNDKEMIPVADYTITLNGDDVSDKLGDNNARTYTVTQGPGEYIVEFNEAQPIVGMAYRYGYSYWYVPTEIEMQTSNDGVTWESQTGGKVNPEVAYGYVAINLYSPITCKFVKFVPSDCMATQWYGDSYNTPCVGDLRFYR